MSDLYEFDEELIEGDEILESINKDALCQSGYPSYFDANTVKQASNSSAMTADFIAVTRGSEVNRHGNMVQITAGGGGKGMMLQNFKQNPVWLFDHGQSLSLPIGTARNQETQKIHVSRTEEKMTARIFFSQTLPEAAQIFALVDENILRAASVQFRPLKARFLREKGRSRRGVESDDGLRDLQHLGIDFVESELMEISIVAIGADQFAIKKTIERRSINNIKLGSQVIESLRQYATEEPATIPVQIDLKAIEEARAKMQNETEIQNSSSITTVATTEDPRVAVDSKHRDVVQTLIDSGHYIDNETDKEVFLLPRVVQYAGGHPAESDQWDESRETMKVQNWAADGKSKFDARDPDTRDRYRQAFAFVSGQGTDSDDYQLLHHTVEDGELVVSLIGCSQAAEKISEIDKEHQDAVMQTLDKHAKEQFDKEPFERQAEKNAEVSKIEVDRISKPTHPKILIATNRVEQLIQKQEVEAKAKAVKRQIEKRLGILFEKEISKATAELQTLTSELDEAIDRVSTKITK